MTTNPILGSFVWVASSLAFLAASTSVVRLLEARAPSPTAAPRRPREAVDR